MQQLTLTTKQKEIPPLIYRFRFLDRIQIQQLLNNKNHRNIHVWLNDLVQKKLLGKIYNQSPAERILPTIYYTDLQGIKYLRKQPECNKEYLANMYREKEKTQQFIDRCRFIANIYLDLRNRSTDSSDSFDFFAKHDFPRDEITKKLQPNFGFIRYHNQHKTYTFCKILENGIPNKAVKIRIAKYVDYFKDKANTKLIFICESDETYKSARRFVKRYLDEEEITNLPVSVTTTTEVKEKGIIKRKKEIDQKNTVDTE